MKLLKNAGFLFVMMVTLMSCSKDDDHSIPGKDHTTFVLVHGAWQASFVWDKVKASLEAQGNQVVKVELLGHGDDMTPASQITFEGYVEQVKDAVSNLNTPVVLVGHSLGGAIVTQAASEIPDKIAQLVYVAGFIPQSGSSVFDYSAMDKATLIPGALAFSEDGSTVTIAEPKVNMRDIFCQFGTQDDIDALVEKLRPEPVVAAGTPLDYDSKIYKGIANRYYIYTTEDQAISYPFQQQMVAEAEITKTYQIKAGHSPFLSKPEELAQIFNTIVKQDGK